jgi:DNA-binding response OmpR family regulator
MPPITKIRIILLEDTDSIRNSLKKMLTVLGYEVFSFPNPMMCPLQTKPDYRCGDNQTCADIIVSDLDMPNMTGLNFIENQRKRNCKCRYVALMSGFWTEENLSRAHKLGCKVFTKPFPVQALFEWIDEAKRHIEPARELRRWFEENDPVLDAACYRMRQ